MPTGWCGSSLSLLRPLNCNISTKGFHSDHEKIYQKIQSNFFSRVNRRWNYFKWIMAKLDQCSSHCWWKPKTQNQHVIKQRMIPSDRRDYVNMWSLKQTISMSCFFTTGQILLCTGNQAYKLPSTRNTWHVNKYMSKIFIKQKMLRTKIFDKTKKKKSKKDLSLFI